MRNRVRVVAVLAMAALCGWGWGAGRASAWNDAGHMTVGLMTYRALPEDKRAVLDEILKHHPRWEQDLLRGAPEGLDDAGKREYAFARAGTWPDMIRPPRRGTNDVANPMSAAYRRSNWHYTDVPFHPEGGEEKYIGETARPLKPGEPYDSISAWEWNLARLNDVSLPMAERAIALCWVLHVGGDCHQPLHNVSLYSARFPTGDKGGNEWIFMNAGNRENLHWIWDGLLGRDSRWSTIRANADRLERLQPLAKADAKALATTDIRQWVQEGRFLAIEHAYLGGKLTGVSNAELKADPSLATPEIPAAYVEASTKIAEVRGPLAAWRLAETFKRSPLPVPPATRPSIPEARETPR